MNNHALYCDIDKHSQDRKHIAMNTNQGPDYYSLHGFQPLTTAYNVNSKPSSSHITNSCEFYTPYDRKLLSTERERREEQSTSQGRLITDNGTHRLKSELELNSSCSKSQRSSIIEERRIHLERSQAQISIALKADSMPPQPERADIDSGAEILRHRTDTLMEYSLKGQEHDERLNVTECKGFNEKIAPAITRAENNVTCQAIVKNSLLDLFQNKEVTSQETSAISWKPTDEKVQLDVEKISRISKKTNNEDTADSHANIFGHKSNEKLDNSGTSLKHFFASKLNIFLCSKDYNHMQLKKSHDNVVVTIADHNEYVDGNKNDSSYSLLRSLELKIRIFVSSTVCDYKQFKTTIIAAFLYSLYQMVFCFTVASAITRPSHPTSSSSGLLAPMALMACVGNLLTAPLLVVSLGGNFPALYPCLDLFIAPFLAKMAADVDEVLALRRDSSDSLDREQDDFETFLATFSALNSFGMALCGLLCILAVKIKLANLAGFLPYPVLCGFFSAVGVNTWMAAFRVDTGVTIQKIIASGDSKLFFINLFRHIPSFVTGVVLYRFGPRNPIYLIGIISATVVLAYIALVITNTSLEEAQDMGFFWKQSEVIMTHEVGSIQNTWGLFGLPSPFGLWLPSVLRKIYWPAFLNGVKDVLAMSVIYLLRCSIHAMALKKSVDNSMQNETKERLNEKDSRENVTHLGEAYETMNKKKPKSVFQVLVWYAYGLLAISISSGFAVLPGALIRSIFIQIDATTRTPQFIAMVVIFGCYLSDLRLVCYVPKCTFSSLLVLSAIDFIHSWFVKSYHKTSKIYEWLVIPLIISVSLLSGMLESVALGVGASTFIFVAQFYRSGVVKFVSSGLTIRSTIERGWEDSKWLDQHGDLIQVVVIQNYLYFGNATSCLKNISKMFDDDNNDEHHTESSPMPKYVILDMSIVTGIDTSAVDVLAEIATLCKSRSCRLILSGIPRTVRPTLIVCGLKPSREYSHLLFMEDLDSSLGRAEDDLLQNVAHNEERLIKAGNRLRNQRIVSMIDHGLRYALSMIDEQHGISFAQYLTELENYAIAKELQAGEELNETKADSLPRGLYFIESGLIKCEHDASVTLTRGRQRVGLLGTQSNCKDNYSIGRTNARSVTAARNSAKLEDSPRRIMAQFEHTFRLGRFGPGWVIGTISEFTGQEIPGTYICMTPCRVHQLTFETIEKLEIDKPVLVLNLYKMLAHIMARRQELTIGQLSTLRSIMSASAPTKPFTRRSIIAVNNLMKTQYQ